MGKLIQVGLIGVGRAGNGIHCANLRVRKDKYQLAAVCDLEQERMQKVTDEFGARQYATAEELVKDKDIELVIVATRSCDHYYHAKIALEAGKNVVMEKPFCVSYEQAEELFELGSKPAGPHLYIHHNRRFEYGFQKALEVIDSGKLGRVYEIKLTRNSYHRRNDWQTISEFGGGQLLNWGPHIVDHSIQFCGGDYVDMYSNIQHVAAAGDCEDHIKIVFTGINGTIVDMEISGGAALPTPEYMIYGSKGSMVSSGNAFKAKYLDPSVELSKIEADPNTPGTGASFSNNEKLPWIEEEIPFVDGEGIGNGTTRYWDYLYETLTTGKAFPVKLHEALKNIEVIDQVKSESMFAQY